MKRILALTLLGACSADRTAEAPNWYDSGAARDVSETVVWDETPYPFGASGGLQDLRQSVIGCYSQESVGACDGSFVDAEDFIRIFWGPDAPQDVTACSLEPTDQLPVELEVMVTVLPQFYLKGNSCEYEVGNGTDEATDKYYASFFVEDASGGMFVLADQRIAHFTAGDTLRMTVRSIGRAYDMDAVYAYDIEAIERDARGVYYQPLSGTETLGPDHRGRVVRAVGTVVTEPDDFGTYTLISDDGAPVNVQGSLEINRRGAIEYPVGTRLQVTGPVLYTYSSHNIVVTQVGQIEVLESAD